MKLVIVSVLLSASSIFAFARTVTIEVPDHVVSYDKIVVNFDGSYTIVRPTVFANGAYLPIIKTTYIYTPTASLACQLFELPRKVVSGTLKAAGDPVIAAHLGYSDKDGRVILFQVGETASVFETVTCGN